MRRRRILGKGITSIGQWIVTISSDSSNIGNTGGSITITSRASREIVYTDGTTKTEIALTSLSTDYGTLSNNVLTVKANTSTSDKLITVTATYKNASNSITITLAGKTVTNYSDWTVSLSANKTSLANVGDTTNITSSASRTLTWTDGGTSTETGAPTLTTDTGSITSNVLTVPLNASTTSKTITVTATHANVSETLTISQAASTKVYGNVVISNHSVSQSVPASGGTYTIVPSYSQTWTWNGVSGTGGTITSGATITYPSGVANGLYTIASLGSTIKTSTTSIVKQASVILNGKSATQTITFTQAINVITSIDSVVFNAGTYNATTGSGVHSCPAASSIINLNMLATVHGTLSSKVSGVNITSLVVLSVLTYSVSVSESWLYSHLSDSSASTYDIGVQSRGIITGDVRTGFVTWSLTITTKSNNIVSRQVTNKILIAQAANKEESLTISKGNYSSWASTAYADATIDGVITDWSGAYTWDGYITYTSTERQGYTEQPYTTFRFDSSNSYIEFLGTNAVCKSDYYSNYTIVYGFYGVVTIGELTAEYKYSNSCYIFGVGFFDDYEITVRYEPDSYSYANGISVAVVSGNFSEFSVQASDLPYNAVLFSWNSDDVYQYSLSISYCIKRNSGIVRFLSKGLAYNYLAYNPGTKKWEGCDMIKIYYYLGSSSHLSEYELVSSISATIYIRGDNVRLIA